ncbi:unannotated protein [freshwater metagenome]|uniref:Unannotated protein n=1 Tax=freshwater metagenome TaxID=449393 RepID=A0A6J6EBI1_9ZZZZ|nr:hypothetical protein [Actinomycetota bacterium]
MCTRRFLRQTPWVVLAAVLISCGGPQRTGTNFCRQLAKELPAIGQPMATTQEVAAMVGRYERLLEVAPLTIEKDLAVLTDLLQQAEKVNPNDTAQLQALADASYAANQSSLTVRDWVKSTCAVDITTGVNVEPPRIATTTIPATPTTDVPNPGTTTTVAP